MFPKDTSTEADTAAQDTAAQDTCSPEGHNSKSTKVQGDKQDASGSETPKYAVA